MSVLDAARSSRLAALQAARDALAAQIDAGGGTVAQCVAQFRAVLAEIDELDPPEKAEKVSGLSEFEKRLAERQQAPAGKGRAAGK